MMTSADPMLEVRETYLSLVSKTSGGDFRTLPEGDSSLPDNAFFESLSWCNRVFRVPVHQPDDTTDHAYHKGRPGAPVDFLRHRLIVDSVPVTVYEASSFFVVFVPATSFTAKNPAEKAMQAAMLLLELKGPVTFKPIAADPAHRSYSTNADLPATGLGDWTRRIDAVVFGDELALVVYKVTYDDMMTLVSDPSTWFEYAGPSK
jgi:hypothetical protein